MTRVVYRPHQLGWLRRIDLEIDAREVWEHPGGKVFRISRPNVTFQIVRDEPERTHDAGIHDRPPSV